ncbi:hypothetical protein AX16_006040 [Volvariella volvacea WC 439]|nr:hypothetical protein AX16_006040 [Volvariella volvacea WC 439]
MANPAAGLSSSRLRTSAPVRAIASTLATRSSPSIPQPAESYEPCVKATLRHRLVSSIFFHSLSLTWILVATWTIWSCGGYQALGFKKLVLSPLTPWTVFSTLLVWLVAALPAIVIRKVYLAPARSTTTSPSQSIVAAFPKPSTWRILTTYLLSALLLARLYASLVYQNESFTFGDPRLTLFVKSRKHPYYLNGRFFFLLISQFTVGVGYSLRQIILDRFAFRWSLAIKPSTSQHPFGFLDILTSFVIAVLSATLLIPISAVLLASGRAILPILYTLPFLPAFLKPFTAHFLKGSWTVLLPFHHFSLLCRAWVLATSTILIWEAAGIIFDAYVTHPVSVKGVTADPNVALLSGVSSKDKTFQFFAYSELRELASSDAAADVTRRTALFGDQKYSPNLWSHLVRESLLTLGRDYQLFLRKGQPEPAPAAPVTPAPAAQPAAIPGTPVPLVRTQIYKAKIQSPVKNVVDSLASDGAVIKALDEGAEAVKIPELFQTVENAVLPEPAKADAFKVVEVANSVFSNLRNNFSAIILGFVEQYAPQPIGSRLKIAKTWWSKERTSKTVEACLPNRELDVAIVEVLSRLTCASLQEDQFGVVQRDIPKILEALLSFLSAIDEYRSTVSALYTPPSQDAELSEEELEGLEAVRREVEKANEVLGMVADGLKDGVSRIVRTFGDKLLAFKFPTRIAHQLQGFLDYC